MTPLFHLFMWFLAVTGCRRRLALALVDAEGLTLLPAGWMMFDPALADEIGINKAIILQKVDGWIRSNLKRHHNIIQGRAWSYNTIPNWQKEFCWLTKNYVGELLRQLERDGRLVSDFLASKPQDRTKYYSTQIGLWESENPILREQKVVDDSSIENPSKANPSIQKPKTTATTARARKPLSSGAVAVFPTFQHGGDPLERKAEAPEAHDWQGLDESDHTIKESPTNASVKAPFPVPRGFPQAGPHSPAGDEPSTEQDFDADEETKSSGDTKPVDVPEWMPNFFTGCKSGELMQLLQQFKESTLLEARTYAENPKNHIENPPGFIRAMLPQGWRPPAGHIKRDSWDLTPDEKARIEVQNQENLEYFRQRAGAGIHAEASG